MSKYSPIDIISHLEKALCELKNDNGFDQYNSGLDSCVEAMKFLDTVLRSGYPTNILGVIQHINHNIRFEYEK